MALAILFFVACLASEALAQAPPAPTQYAPSGSIMNPTPTYTWSAVSGANKYYLEVSSPTAPVYTGFFFPTNCSAGICSATPGIALTAGPYGWYVQAQGPGGKTWSLGMSFTVVPPPAATQVSPSGATYTPTPTYTWNAVTAATSYFLQVSNGTTIVFQGGYTVSQVCPGGPTCSLTAPTPLAQGPYNWAVKSMNASGGTWSAGMNFTVIPPPAPTLSLPSGATYTPRPTYTWSAVAGATQYSLEVDGSAGRIFQTTYPASSVCPDSACSSTPTTSLAQGSYTWLAQASNASGGTWSAPKSFTVQGPPAPTPQAPTGSGTNATPTYRWSATGGGVTYYVLSVNPVDGGTAAFTVNFDPNVCSGGTCSANPPNALRTGSYTWQVRGWNATGVGDLSSAMTFTVTGPPVPTPLAPTGSGTNATPTYQWTAVGGDLLFYVLSVNPVDPDGTPYFEIWYQPNVCSPGGICSGTPPNVLKAGSYTWQIRGRNAAGPGDLSNPVSFTVTGPPIPNPLSPSGALTTPVPTFSWSAVGGNVIVYNLGVSKADLTSVYEVQYDPSGCTATCSVMPNHPLPLGSYTWAVRGRNAAGPGGWSNPMAFSVQPPAPPIPLAPTGKVPTETPTFSWTVSSGAMDYTLSVLNESGGTVYQQGAGTDACTNGICSVTPAAVLGVGVPYRWRVRGQHLAGIGEWSALLDFHVASLDDCDLEFVTADFNGDGTSDGLCQTEGDVYVALGDGLGGFGVARVWLVHTFTRLLFGDFNGDGKTDLADVNVQTGDFLVARSTGSAFEPLTSWGIARATWGGKTYTCQGESLIAGAELFDAGPLTDVYCRDSSLRFFLGLSNGTAFVFSIIDDPPPAFVPVQEYIYAGPRPLAITGAPRP